MFPYSFHLNKRDETHLWSRISFKKPQRFRAFLWWKLRLFFSGTLIEKKRKFSSYIWKFRVIGCKAMTNSLLYVVKICAFPHILRSPSSNRVLHPITSEFPYIWRKFSFIFYQCMNQRIIGSSIKALLIMIDSPT